MATTQKNQSSNLPSNDQNVSAEISAQDALQMVADGRRLKASLKQLSKNQLVQLLIEQVNFSIEQQNVNKVLLEKLKEQK